MSNEVCDVCGFDDGAVCRAERRSMATCDVCERTLCLECLKKLAEKYETVPVYEIDGREDASELMCDCAEHGTECPRCFEAEEGEDGRPISLSGVVKNEAAAS